MLMKEGTRRCDGVVDGREKFTEVAHLLAWRCGKVALKIPHVLVAVWRPFRLATQKGCDFPGASLVHPESAVRHAAASDCELVLEK